MRLEELDGCGKHVVSRFYDPIVEIGIGQLDEQRGVGLINQSDDGRVERPRLLFPPYPVVMATTRSVR